MIGCQHQSALCTFSGGMPLADRRHGPLLSLDFGAQPQLRRRDRRDLFNVLLSKSQVLGCFISRDYPKFSSSYRLDPFEIVNAAEIDRLSNKVAPYVLSISVQEYTTIRILASDFHFYHLHTCLNAQR